MPACSTAAAAVTTLKREAAGNPAWYSMSWIEIDLPAIAKIAPVEGTMATTAT